MSETKLIQIKKIIVTEDNPRRTFDEESLRNLSESIRTHGLLQPIVVRPRSQGYYELVIGERRLRAAQLAGLHEIEAKIQDFDDNTAIELRLIENTHREDLTDPEKGNAVYRLFERFPEKYTSIEYVAKAIGKSPATVTKWCDASDKISPKLLSLVQLNKLERTWLRWLIQYPPKIQEKLARTIIKHNLPATGLVQRKPRFLELFDQNPNRDLGHLAEETLRARRVEVNIARLPREIRKTVEEIVRKEEEQIRKTRQKRASERAEEKPAKLSRIEKIRRLRTERKPVEEIIRVKARGLAEKLTELEPTQREEMTNAVGKRLDALAKSIDKETLDWMKKWKVEVAPRIKEETPERYAMSLEELMHGIWIRLGVEYPQTVKDLGRKQLVKPLDLHRLEQLQRTTDITVNELEDFQNIIASEVLLRKSKIK